MFTVSYQNLSFEAVTYRPVWPAVSALVVLYCITCSLCLHRCHSNKNDLLTFLLRDINQKIFPILTVTDMSANQWSQFIKKDSGFAFLAYWNDMLVRNIILIILTFDVIIMAVNLSKIFCQECFESNV